ncbi:MAG: DNA-binding protein [Clostridiales bacterium]|nr:DNA-binding protein [Clostridiales bacterium]
MKEVLLLKVDKLQKTMLFDFYGDLLTEKQREYYDLYHNEDLSLSEIAENVGITRQGVYDIITRAESTLTEIEKKTGLIRRFGEMRAEIAHAVRLAEEIKEQAVDDLSAVKASELISLLSSMKG